MKTIAFVIPYFGKLPNSFPIFLESCGINSDIDFFIFTDDRTDYDYPSNVVRIKSTLQDIKERAQLLFDFPISLEHPYKLCDFKPAYGEIFSDYLKGYDFWGWCDLDIVWGNIRNFITDDILHNKYLRILTRGHCSIFPNTENANNLYRKLPDRGCIKWKDAFSSADNVMFDEIPMYNEMVFADVNFLKYRFVTSRSYMETYKNERKWKKTIFLFDTSGLYASYFDGNVRRKTEFMYVHFQKRPLVIHGDLTAKNGMAVVAPNHVYSKDLIQTEDQHRHLAKDRGICFFVLRFRFNQILKKLGLR